MNLAQTGGECLKHTDLNGTWSYFLTIWFYIHRKRYDTDTSDLSHSFNVYQSPSEILITSQLVMYSIGK